MRARELELARTYIRSSALACLSAAAALSAVLPAAAQQDAAPPAAAPPAEAAPAAPPVEPEAPPPVLPTSGDGAVVTTLLSRVCQPLVAGGNLDSIAKSAGLVMDKKLKKYVVALSQRPFQIVVEPQGSNNKNVCELRLQYAPGWDRPIVDSLNTWSFLHSPKMFTQRNDIGRTAEMQRTTTTWDNRENESSDGKRVGVAFSKVQKVAGGPTGVEEATVRYSIRAPEG